MERENMAETNAESAKSHLEFGELLGQGHYCTEFMYEVCVFLHICMCLCALQYTTIFSYTRVQ